MRRRSRESALTNAVFDLDDAPLHGQQVARVAVLLQRVAGGADGAAVGGHHGHGAVVLDQADEDDCEYEGAANEDG
jgi:hypothetical protein